jgi:hypothetical protein
MVSSGTNMCDAISLTRTSVPEYLKIDHDPPIPSQPTHVSLAFYTYWNGSQCRSYCCRTVCYLQFCYAKFQSWIVYRTHRRALKIQHTHHTRKNGILSSDRNQKRDSILAKNGRHAFLQAKLLADRSFNYADVFLWWECDRKDISASEE